MKDDPKTTQAPEFLQRTDSELTVAAKDAIELLTTVPKGTVRATVRDGWINGYVYRAEVPASRPVTDYRRRVIPHRSVVLVPLEADRILWQQR